MSLDRPYHEHRNQGNGALVPGPDTGLESGTAGATASVGYKCPCHGEAFRKPADLSRHIAKAERKFQCKLPDCPSGQPALGTLNDLKRHYRDVHQTDLEGTPLERFCCPWENCKRHREGFPRRANLEGHLQRAHNGRKPLDSETLGRQQLLVAAATSASTSFLPENRIVSEDESSDLLLNIRNFFCPICGEGFKRKDLQNQHMQSRHQNVTRASEGADDSQILDEDGRFACDTPGCGKCFSRKSTLKRHKETQHQVFEQAEVENSTKSPVQSTPILLNDPEFQFISRELAQKNMELRTRNEDIAKVRELLAMKESERNEAEAVRSYLESRLRARREILTEHAARQIPSATETEN